jgi:RES domain-containing protein
MVFRGRVWRHVPSGAITLHIGKIWKHSKGRWNRLEEYACLYTALTRAGAVGELEKVRYLYGSAIGARDLVTIDVHLDPVLDLTDNSCYEALAAAAGVPPDFSLLTREGDFAYEHCRLLADIAREQGYTGLLVPSAAVHGEVNLVIYFDVVAPKQLDIDDGPDRELVP